MGKSTVLSCDTCGAWDSKDNVVRTVSVGGPKEELCANCRVKLIVSRGHDEIKARAYVTAFDNRESTRGNGLSLNGKRVQAELRATMAAAQAELEPSTGDGGVAPSGDQGDTSGAGDLAPDVDEETGEETDEDVDKAAEVYADSILADMSDGDQTGLEGPVAPAQPARGRRAGR